MMEPQMLPMYAELIGVDLLGGFDGSITDIVSGLPVGEIGTEVVTAALTRLGHPYSQEKRGNSFTAMGNSPSILCINALDGSFVNPYYALVAE